MPAKMLLRTAKSITKKIASANMPEFISLLFICQTNLCSCPSHTLGESSNQSA